jgi:hypothetical protein
MGSRYLDALEKHSDTVAHHVRENLLDRHIMRVFAKA